jgi:hypothetical protein
MCQHAPTECLRRENFIWEELRGSCCLSSSFFAPAFCITPNAHRTLHHQSSYNLHDLLLCYS